MPLFAHNLPAYTGQHPVGAIDIEAAVDNPRLIHDAKLNANGEPAFRLDTVLFTLYYPTTEGVTSTKPKHYWVPKPVSLRAEGYARFAHISNSITNSLFTGALRPLVGHLTIPAEVDTPLGGHPPLPEKGSPSVVGWQDTGYPVLILTHGMAASRTDYTQYCGELASQGHIVAAIEHRDGSCPASVVMCDGQPSRNVLHFDLKDVKSESEPDMGMDGFKRAQLAFRQAEIEATVYVLQAINAGHGREVYERNPMKEGVDLENWAGRLNTREMILGGHSYGATGALQALKDGPSPALPFKGAILFDPGKSSGPLNVDINVPVLVVHSNSWSSTHSIFHGRPHFEVVKELVQGVLKRGNEAWFMTSLGTSHPSVTDAPLIKPKLLGWTTGAKIDVHEALKQYVLVSEDFMWYLGLGFGKPGEKRGLLKEKAEFPEYDEESGFGKYIGQGEGWRKYWQVHVAPE